MRHVKRLLPVLLAFCIVLCGCRANSPNAQTDSAPAEPGSLVFYYTNETHTSLIPYSIVFNLSNFMQDEMKLSAVIERLEMVPEKELFSIIPSGMILQIALQQTVDGGTNGQSMPENDKRILQIYLSKEYGGLLPNEKALMRTGMAKVLFATGLIDEIVFMMESSEEGVFLLVDELNASDDLIINQYGADVLNDEVTVKLYFMNESRTALVVEERSLALGMTEPLSYAIMDALIDGPQQSGHLPTIPEGTQINDIVIENGVCYVDLSEEFRLNHEGSEILETLTIYSIVNSLSGISELSYVQFLIGGERVEFYKSYVRIDQFLEPNMQYVEAE